MGLRGQSHVEIDFLWAMGLMVSSAVARPCFRAAHGHSRMNMQANIGNEPY
jgi:hypothetical protein